MLNKTKIVLAAALFAATSSAALAQGYDPNLANRYPGLANPGVYGYAGGNAPTLLNRGTTFQSAQVQLRHGRDAGLTSRNVALTSRNVALPSREVAPLTGETRNYGSQDWFDIERSDRASSPYAGGG